MKQDKRAQTLGYNVPKGTSNSLTKWEISPILTLHNSKKAPPQALGLAVGKIQIVQNVCLSKKNMVLVSHVPRLRNLFTCGLLFF